MASINYSDLRRGYVIQYESDLYVVTETEHITPGNWRGMMQIKLKSLRTGNLMQRRFRPGDKVEIIYVEKKEMEYLYRDSGGYVFMDTTTYEQSSLSADVLGEDVNYLKPNTLINVQLFEGKIIGISLPDIVELTVTETDPSVKGQTATNQYKPATTETGLRITVPPFIQQGEVVRVDTRTGKYLERAK